MKLKELEDFDWFPGFLREMQLEYIGWLSIQIPIYKPIIPFMKSTFQSTDFPFFDLCSGSGWPGKSILNEMLPKEKILLSDKYPPKKFQNTDKVQFINYPFDVLKMKFESANFYTMFNSFHHFSDDEKKEIITKLKIQKCNFCFVEILSPTIKCVIQVIFASTLLQVLLCPFVKPFSMARIFYTLLLPVNVLTVLIDGVISVFKSRSLGQYQSLISSINTESYRCSTVAVKQFFGDVIIISGTPK